MSCELGSIVTTEPTEGTQHREYWGGPTNCQAAALLLLLLLLLLVSKVSFLGVFGRRSF